MNVKTMFAKLGWDSEQQVQLDMIVSNTRDTMKHAIFGMRALSLTEEPFIRVYDRSTSKVLFDSDILDDRDSCIEVYDALIKHYNLPYCCLVHRKELTQLEGFEDDNDDEGPTGLVGFDDDPEDEDDSDLGLDGFEDDDEDDFNFNLDDDEEDFDFDLD